MTLFLNGFFGALTIPSLIAVLIVGPVCGYVIGSVHRSTSTPITPTLVVFLACLLMFGLQLATFVGASVNIPPSTEKYMGSHLGYIVLSLFDGVACGVGVVISQKVRYRGK